MRKQLKSFAAAFRGFFSAIATEGHLRFHLVAAVYVIAFSFFYEMDAVKWAVIVILISLIISAELINSAIETLCDRVTRDYDEMIKTVKDISAAAVLVLSVGAVVAAFLFYFDLARINFIFNYFTGNPLVLILFLISLIISVLFIVPGPVKIINHFNKPKK